MICVKDLLNWIDTYAPFSLAEKWDHCGLQVGNPAEEVKRVLVALDVSSRTLEEAIRLDCRCLVTHHPLIFQPMESIREDEYPGMLVTRAIRSRLSLIAAHTNLDIAHDGTNDRLSALLGLNDIDPLEQHLEQGSKGRSLGLGRVGSLPAPCSLTALARDLEGALGGSKVRVVGDGERVIRRIALCTGSGGSLLDRAVAAGVDAYVTGDIKYHEAQRALEENVALVDVGHFPSERIIVHPLAEYFRCRSREIDAELEVFESTEESDPFWYV